MTRFLLLCLIVFIGCKSNFNKNLELQKLNPLPPGCIKISDNLFADESEISNKNYREYQFWVKKVFGIKSNEYEETRLDTTVWKKVDGLSMLVSSYHVDGKYSNYPVVGVSLTQAKLFTEWRTERVAEKKLIDLRIMSFDVNQTANNHFTLANFINGSYEYIKGDKDLTEEGMVFSYPEYRVPNAKEWELISGIETDELIDSYVFDKYNKEVKRKHKHFFNTKDHYDSKRNKNKDFNETNGKMIVTSPTRSFAKNKYGMYGIIGNVSEMIDIQGFSKGGDWNSYKVHFSKEKNNEYPTANCWTGFRNICYIKVIKMKNGN